MQEPQRPVIEVTDSAATNELDSLKQIDCQVGGEVVNGECPRHEASHSQGTKAKRKARSTRRRLNAMISNASIHFSDTDSEGELTTPRVATPNHAPNPVPAAVAAAIDDRLVNSMNGNLLHPVISVTLDGSDDSSFGGDRRNSFIENLTDVDEIYTSDIDNEAGAEKPQCKSATPRGSLTVQDNLQQGETDLEDMSNEDEDEVHQQIVVTPRSDILCDFNGETITTKEGDGPFSVEIRNQMSIDEPSGPSCTTPDILIMPTTDSEDMEASDEDEEEGACAQREVYEDFDVIAASQIVMKNVDKMEQQLLSVKDPEDAISDNHTDTEDFE